MQSIYKARAVCICACHSEYYMYFNNNNNHHRPEMLHSPILTRDLQMWPSSRTCSPIAYCDAVVETVSRPPRCTHHHELWQPNLNISTLEVIPSL